MLIFFASPYNLKIYIGLIIRYISLKKKKEKIIPKLHIFTWTRTQDSFRVCDFSPCNLITETNKFCLGAVRLSCLVSELQKASSSELEPRTAFRCRGLCLCNLLVKTNNFGFGAVLLSCLVSVLQEPPSPGIELMTLFPEFLP
jgi:hypothetical protein